MIGWEGWRRWGREEVWRVRKGRGGWMNWLISSHSRSKDYIQSQLPESCQLYSPQFAMGKWQIIHPANIRWHAKKKKMGSCYYLMFPIMWTPFYQHLSPRGSISNSTMHVSLTIGGTLWLSGPLLNGGIKFEVMQISINWEWRHVFWHRCWRD